MRNYPKAHCWRSTRMDWSNRAITPSTRVCRPSSARSPTLPPPGGRVRPRPRHPRHPPRRGRHRAADGSRPGAARRFRRRLDAAARTAQCGRAEVSTRAPSSPPGTWSRSSTPPSSWSANSSPTRCATARVRSGCACCWTGPSCARCGTRASSSRAGTAPATRTRGAGAAARRSALRLMGFAADAARHDGLVRTPAAGRRHAPHGSGGGVAEPVLTAQLPAPPGRGFAPVPAAGGSWLRAGGGWSRNSPSPKKGKRPPRP